MHTPHGGENSPQAIYQRQLKLYEQRLAAERRSDRLLGYSKIAVGLVVFLFLVRFVYLQYGFRYLLIPAAIFAILVVLHDHVLVRIRGINAVIAFYRRAIARLEDRWAGHGETGERFLTEAHPYARDLDIFGPGSLFELLCIFRTRAGEETLARWLLEPAPPTEILARQDAVRDLQPRVEFREKLFTAGNRVRLGVHPEKLAQWGEREFAFPARIFASVAVALALCWIASLVYSAMNEAYTALILVSALNIFVNRHLQKRLAGMAAAAEEATPDLDILGRILNILEQETFSSARLIELQVALRSDGVAPSVAIRKLDRIIHYLEQRKSLFVQIFDGFLFYSVLWTIRAESWHKTFGPSIRGWLAITGQMEALAALSCYAFEHPCDTWPEFAEGPACFDAEGLAHPLLPESKAVRNDFKLGGGLQLVVLSGPNMSGKSTFVRGIGVNAVLAQCGAPVRATRLRMTPLAVGASICVLDSLQGGISRFYAEIRRLKLISDLTQGPMPVLFLLDELLSGTNSHDRFEGTQLVVRSLVEHNAIGLVTTHDLALARIPDSMNGRARNDHFEDHFKDGKLAFDFKLKPGIVQTSNALKLMESIGLLSDLPPSPPPSAAEPPEAATDR